MSTQIVTYKNVNKLVTSDFTAAVNSFIECGRKIPAVLWNANPAACQSLRDKHNGKATVEVARCLADGYQFVKTVESKTGAVASIKMKKIADGGKRAAGVRAGVGKLKELESTVEAQARVIDTMAQWVESLKDQGIELPPLEIAVGQ